MNNGRTPILGLRISAVLLAVFGCLLVIYVLLAYLPLVVFVIRHWQGHLPASHNSSSVLILLVIFTITAALAYLCFRAAAGLRDGQRWAAHVATGFGLLLLLFSADFSYDWFHPYRQSPDDYFGLLIVSFCVTVGLWLCIYLNLPRVKAHLKSLRN